MLSTESIPYLFQLVKEQKFPDVFLMYVPGAKLRPVRKGYMTNCPLHGVDKNPSFMVYNDGWRCFACGEYGDAVDFAAKMTGQRKLHAAREIAARFGLITDTGQIPQARRAQIVELQREQELKTAFTEWERQTFLRLVGFRDAIRKAMNVYGVDVPEPLALIVRDYMPQIEYYIEIISNGTHAEKVSLFRWRVV